MIKTKQIFNIRETAEILVPDRLARTSYLVALLLTLMMASLITLIQSKLPSKVPLFFSLPWGENRLAPKLMLYLLPGTTVLLMIFNWGLGRVANKLSPLLPRVLAVASGGVAIMMTISLLGIIQSLIL